MAAEYGAEDNGLEYLVGVIFSVTSKQTQQR